MYPAARRIALD